MNCNANNFNFITVQCRNGLHYCTVMKLKLLALQFIRSLYEGNFNIHVHSHLINSPHTLWFFALDHVCCACWLPLQIPYSKKLWQITGFCQFYYFHNIPYANGLKFANVFSAKLPIVLIHQNFSPPKFLLYDTSHKCTYSSIT